MLAPSWAQFLSDVADELVAGNFAVDLRAEGEEFRLARPQPGDLRRNCRAWSAAKLTGKRLD